MSFMLFFTCKKLFLTFHYSTLLSHIPLDVSYKGNNLLKCYLTKANIL